VNAQAVRMLSTGHLTAPRVAELLGLTAPRIYQLLGERRLSGQRIGRAWYIDLRSLRRYLTEDVPPDQQPTSILREVDRLLSLSAESAPGGATAT
jgi:excisionase family DNA binding protein